MLTLTKSWLIMDMRSFSREISCDEIKIYSFILYELENLIDLMVVIYRKRNIFQQLLVPIQSNCELYARLKTSHLLDSTFKLIEDIAVLNRGLKLLKR